MLLVDFNLAEYLQSEADAEGKQILQMVSCVPIFIHKLPSHLYQGTPIFIARAVERGGPVPPVLTIVPGIPNSPDIYAEAHPDRVTKFRIAEIKIIDPEAVVDKPHDGWRHELEHDAESVFWLLLYWAMVVQPKNCSEEEIDASSWSLLNGNYKKREALIRNIGQSDLEGFTHSFYKCLLPLIKNLAAILVVDSHWLPKSDSRKDPSYITEAFQRLILQFIIDNRGEEFMNRRVEQTFRKVQGMRPTTGWSATPVQSLAEQCESVSTR